ncbi:fatty acyl-CoA hydrolase precursor, medium chain-like [Lissotriton helveticus]
MRPGWGTTFALICLVTVRTAVASKGPDARGPLVTTKYGQVQGTQLRVEGTDRVINTFLGIPFARPPLKELRFSPPERPTPWTDVRDATAYPPVCIQDLKGMDIMEEIFLTVLPDFTISEDCLYLNIHTPAEAKNDEKLPVMVFIHGGGLVMGGASMYDGSAIAAYENVVVVSIQYRLGTLGYFSTGDEHARGNWGFLDQVAALQWIQENIEPFRGDPESVTIFGESAGGISVSALVLSPLSKGLFHKAISQSGVAILPGFCYDDQEQVAAISRELANLTGCDFKDSAALVNCMRKKSEEEILKPFLTGLKVVPGVTDGVFLPKNPEEILADHESNPVPFIIGVNNQEFGWIIPVAMNISQSTLKEGLDRQTVDSFLRMSAPVLGSMAESIHLLVDEYLGNAQDPIIIRDSYFEMLADMTFVIPGLKTARHHRDSGHPVYFYEFQHRPSQYGDSRPDFVKADHGDELGFVFGGPFMDHDVIIMGNATDEEKDLSKKMMKYWANFARTGNPNGDGLAEWPVYAADEQYLQLSLHPKAGKQLKQHRMTFWSETLPEKINAINAQRKMHEEL